MTIDPGPSPDLSNYAGDFCSASYEWFLSDHPWAVAERERRAARYYREELERAAYVQEWADKIEQSAPGTLGSLGFEEPARRLAETLRPMAEKSQRLAEERSAAPQTVAVLEERRRLEISRHVQGDTDYAYPAHLIGPGAAAYPPPVSGFPAGETPAHDTKVGQNR